MQTTRIKSEGKARKTTGAGKKTKAPVRNASANGAAKPAAVPKKKTPAKKRKPNATVTREEIALRAYFLAEKRRVEGLPGNELGDWVEAERLLLVEKQAE